MSTNKERPEIVQSFTDTFKSNGTMLTLFAVILILLSGISIVDNRENWWVSIAAISAFFLVTFLFMNSRVILKSIFVTFITLMLTAGAFQLGMQLDSFGVAAITWMGQVLFLFFALLAYSYATMSGRSRWALLGLTQIVTFIITLTLMSLPINPLIGIAISTILGISIFVIFYKFLGKTRYSKTNMPKNILTDETAIKLVEDFQKAGWDATALPDKDNGGGVLVWDTQAFYLYPVELEAPFGVIGRKTQRLSYNGKSLNSWLLNIVFNNIPLWRSRGADITLVLIDVNSQNGKKVKIIGAGLPDTKKKLPIGVLPLSISGEPKETSKIIKEIEDTLSTFKSDLTEKQLNAMARIGKIEEEEETEGANKDE